MLTINELELCSRYWGKADPEYPGSAKWHPLVYHCLDVAAVGAAWCEESPAIRNIFQLAFAESEERTRAWILFFIALHDLGKFDIRFQFLAVEALLAAWPEFNPKDADKERGFHHGAAGLQWAAREYQSWLEVPDESREIWASWRPWIEAVTGHHGEWATASRISDPEAEPVVIQHDRNSRRAFVLGLADLFLKPAGLSISDSPPECSSAAQHLLAGFCSVCDWVGSNTEVSPYRAANRAQTWHDFFLERQAEIRSKRWVARLGLAHGVEKYAGLAALLKSDESPRGVQVRMDDLPIEPGLVLIEAPTGSGKTEAALARAWQLLAIGYADSVVFALPTQATANAMLIRVKDFARRVFGDDSANVVLAHGKRDFNHLFERMVEAGKNHTAQGREEAGAQCSVWLAQSRKRVFLGQVGVCTVDQVLLSVLPVRHKFVRGFGVNKAVLIVDEVHAYDAYMHGLLAEVLRRQREAGGSAVLLSATLPSSVRNKLLSAWGAKSRQVTDYPAIWMVPSRASYSAAAAADKLQPITIPEEQQPAERTVHVELLRLPEAVPDDALLGRVITAAQAGAKVAVIVNLVDVAQAMARRLRAMVETLAPSGVTVDLFHARYRFLDRQSKEDNVSACYGRESKREGVRILVATQVVEQSLDLDFDWMITQICPVDLLFQRLGRLHRHEWRNDRPKDFRLPQCTVLSVEGNDYGLHKLIYGNTRVLWRTDQLLAEGKTIEIVFPAAYRNWVDTVYSDRDWPDEPAAISRDYDEYWGRQRASEQEAAAMISTPRLKAFNDDDQIITIKTRDGEMSLSILPLAEDGSLLDGTTLDAMDERALAETLALNVVPVPHSWTKLLHGVPLDEEGRYRLSFKWNEAGFEAVLPGGTRLRYSEEFGMEKQT